MKTTIADCKERDIDQMTAQGGSFLRVGELSSYGVEWSDCSRVTSLGGMAYFGHFLHANGLFDDWVDGCPLVYTSNNAPSKRRVLGTLVSGIVNGARRYAHLSHLQGDRLCAEALHVEDGFASEDSVRRGLRNGILTKGPEWDAWMSRAELAVVLPLLSEPYILDLDTSVKIVYGHQEGAEIGYNPTKPGRPSQALHVGFIGQLRLLATMDVQGGKAHAACHMAPRIWNWIDALPPTSRPRLIRGDIGFGNEGYLTACESRDLPYLFKLKMTAKVRDAVLKLAQQQQAPWQPTTGGWEAIESSVTLTGWSRKRRIVVLRRPLKPGNSKQRNSRNWLPHFATQDTYREWEYAVLVCSRDLPIEALPTLYAERADCENVLDELKNQWGLTGFTTQDLGRCKLMARITALMCNWWNVFARIAEPTEHKEALTSRPELLHLMATLVTHGGKKVLRFSSHHENTHAVKRAFTRLHKVFSAIDSIAGQLNRPTIWAIQLSVAFYAWLHGKVLKGSSGIEKIIHELAPEPNPSPG